MFMFISNNPNQKMQGFDLKNIITKKHVPNILILYTYVYVFYFRLVNILIDI